jgi:DNA polymerase-3 subunit alpha (Gram-positive type)
MLKTSDVNRKIAETNFVFFDVETTGLSPAFGDRVCELAMVQWQGGQAVAVFHSLINPGRPISRAASAINGLTDELVAKAPYFTEVAPDILKFVRAAVLVGHNAAFDLGFLNHHLCNLQMDPIENTVIDTLALARRCFKFPSNNLGNIARTLGLPITEEHRALGDVNTTISIFQRFLEDLKDLNIESVGQLIDLQGGEIIVAPVIRPVLPTVVEEAIKSQGRLFIRYVTEFNEEISRIIEPLRVQIVGDKAVLVAYCPFQESELSLPLSQIMEMKPMPVAAAQECP